MLKSQHALYEPSDSTGTFEMADVGLDSTNHQGLFLRTFILEHCADSTCFKGIAYRCASTMSFEEARSFQVQASATIGLANQSLLSFATRLCDARCPTVLIDASSTNDSADGISVSKCV